MGGIIDNNIISHISQYSYNGKLYIIYPIIYIMQYMYKKGDKTAPDCH